MGNLFKLVLLIATIASTIIYTHHQTSLATSSSNVTGEMFPAANSSNITTDIKPFTVDVQLNQEDIKDNQLKCNLYWRGSPL